MKDFIVKTTGHVISLLDKIFDSNIHYTGVDNIPKKGPILFVADHFTRSETFLLPYVIHKVSGKTARSLAHKSVFVGALGNYLRKLGTISTDNPDRNETIIGDLMTGRNNWLIYPEGNMMKNKKVTRKNKRYQLHLKDGVRDMFTGSAVIASQAELLKRDYFKYDEHNQTAQMQEFADKYFLEQDVPTRQSLAIVPVNLSYYPVRTGTDNSFYKMVDRLAGGLKGRIQEEIEIESNILNNADIDVHFGNPIYVNDYIQATRSMVERLGLNKNKGLLSPYRRYGLTDMMMYRIYSRLFINIDHLFAACLDSIKHGAITKWELKNLIYLSYRNILHLHKYKFHKSLHKNATDLLSTKDTSYFDDILAHTAKQGQITIEGNNIKINRDAFAEEHEFHNIRQHNMLRVLCNEIYNLKDVTKIIKRVCQLPAKKRNAKIADVIFRDDLSEFTEDYATYKGEMSSNIEYSKPYVLEGDNRVGVVLSHGYKSSPREVYELAQYLNKAGYTIYAPRLKGHGTNPINLKYTQWQDWHTSYNKAYAYLRNKCDKVVVAGFSTGGLLSILNAANNRVDGLICINAALKLNDIKVKLVPAVNFWNELVGKISDKITKEYIDDTPEYPDTNYSRNYLKGVYELGKLMEISDDRLADISVPSLIIQAKNDPVVNPKSGSIIYDKIKSADKKLIEPDLDNHVIIRNNDMVYKDIKEFLDLI